jgi:hypothetical protein
MYPEQFWLLRVGDIIKSSRPNSNTYRRIERVSTHEGRTTMIELVKIRPSWTSSPYTLYGTSDAQGFVPVKVKNEAIWDITYEQVQRKRLRDYRIRYRRMARRAQTKYDRMRALSMLSKHNYGEGS